jgi:hypothetical protein
MPKYTFKYVTADNKFKIQRDTESDIDLQLNLDQMLNLKNARHRFIYDIIKDGMVAPSIGSVAEIKTLIASLFAPIQTDDVPSNYKQGLKNIENEMLSIDGIEKINFHVAKSSTASKDSEVIADEYKSDATYIVYESGMGIDKISKATTRYSIITPAAVLDSLSKPKDEADQFFPYNKGDEIIFDESFTKRLGFPNNLIWSTQFIDETGYSVSIKTDIMPNITANIDLKTQTVTSEDSKNKITTFAKAGNAEKNRKIRGQTTPDIQKYKYLLLKELGDVAQVWLYYAYIILHSNKIYNDLANPSPPVNDHLMITTDSVVYFLCKAFGIPVLDTGSRENVMKGECTLKLFQVGEPNYKQHFINLITMESNRIQLHNDNTRKIIGRFIKPGGLGFKLFNFFIKIPESTLLAGGRRQQKDSEFLMPGSKLVPCLGTALSREEMLEKRTITQYKALNKEEQEEIKKSLEGVFEAIIKEINDLTTMIQQKTKELIKSQTDPDLDEIQKYKEDPTILTNKYYMLVNSLIPYKCKQYITILPKAERGAKYVFNYPSSFLSVLSGKIIRILEASRMEMSVDEIFEADCCLQDPTILNDLDDEDIEDEEPPGPSASGASASGGNSYSSNSSIKGGVQPKIQKGGAKDILYYEALIMYFVHLNYIKKQRNYNTESITEAHALFARYYDIFIDYFERHKTKLSFFEKIFEKKTDEEIIEKGKALSDLIRFGAIPTEAEDADSSISIVSPIDQPAMAKIEELSDDAEPKTPRRGIAPDIKPETPRRGSVTGFKPKITDQTDETKGVIQLSPQKPLLQVTAQPKISVDSPSSPLVNTAEGIKKKIKKTKKEKQKKKRTNRINLINLIKGTKGTKETKRLKKK